MIHGMHAIVYTPQAAELRAFIRDKLGFPFADVGDGWLIFDGGRIVNESAVRLAGPGASCGRREGGSSPYRLRLASGAWAERRRSG